MASPERAHLLGQLRRDAERIAGRFELSCRGILAEHPRVKSRYGVCYADGLIKIRLTHAKTGRPLKYSSLVDTLCHELAHLRHFNHGPEFKAFFFQLLSFARREGIYRPGRDDPSSGRRLHVSGCASAEAELPLPVRNGVPVFPDPLSPLSAGTTSLPWERWLAGVSERGDVVALAPPPHSLSGGPAPQPTSRKPTPNRRGPEQLSLF
jgi:hypothetical protein